MANDTELPSVVQLPLNEVEFAALVSCALAFVAEHHPKSSAREKREAAVEAVKALSELYPDDAEGNPWGDLMMRANRLAAVAWPDHFTIWEEKYQ